MFIYEKNYVIKEICIRKSLLKISYSLIVEPRFLP